MTDDNFINNVTLDYAGDFAHIKDSLNDIRNVLGNVFCEISETAGSVYSGGRAL